jgi:hypothetical protein
MGIDLHAKSISDSQKIHNGNLSAGGFNVSLLFTSIDDTPLTQTIQGEYNDVSMTIDADTGMIMTGSKIAISFQQSDLTIWNGRSDIQRWKVGFTNGAGQAIQCEISQVMPDRSFGDVVCICKIISGHI